MSTRRRGNSLLMPGGLFLVSLTWSCFSHGQEPPAAPGGASPTPQLETIAITGERNLRRDATGFKLVVRSEEIRRYGDSNLGAVLGRIPGVTVVSTPGQPASIRFRGLGEGYTQILLNGEPMPTGFSIESISPDLIERIEVYKSNVADIGTQTIAGAINIVLKSPDEKDVPTQQFSVTARSHAGVGGGGVSGRLASRDGPYNAAIGLNADVDTERDVSLIRQTALNAERATQYAWTTNLREYGRVERLTATPSLEWKSSAYQVRAEALLDMSRSIYRALEDRVTDTGQPPDFSSDTLDTSMLIRKASAKLSWDGPLGDEGKFKLKASAPYLNRRSRTVTNGFGVDSNPIVYRTIHSVLTDSGLSVAGQVLRRLYEDHQVAAGLDYGRNRRSETRNQREVVVASRLPENLDEDYQASIAKLALFAQDEWQYSNTLSGYAGLRWERLSTSTDATSGASVHRAFSAASPIMSVIWRVPGQERDQMRLSLARTYKPPTARDLIPRRWVVTDNSATSPNFRGNPALEPELSWSLDIAYESYSEAGGFFGASAFLRSIDNVVLRRTYQEGSTWYSSPENHGSAKVAGVELEAKFRLRQFWRAAPDVSMRASLVATTSTLSDVPPPNNRLADQSPLALTIGADYSFSAELRAGGDIALERQSEARASISQWSTRSARRQLDIFLKWSATPRSTLRLTARNLLAPTTTNSSAYRDDSFSEERVKMTSGVREFAATWNITF